MFVDDKGGFWWDGRIKEFGDKEMGVGCMWGWRNERFVIVGEC